MINRAASIDLWFDVPLRPTRDIDLLGFGPAEEPLVLAAFQEICQIECDDGIEFDLDTLKIEESGCIHAIQLSLKNSKH